MKIHTRPSNWRLYQLHTVLATWRTSVNRRSSKHHSTLVYLTNLHYVSWPLVLYWYIDNFTLKYFSHETCSWDHSTGCLFCHNFFRRLLFYLDRGLRGKTACSLNLLPQYYTLIMRCGLDGPGIESRWEQGFSRPSRPALGPTQYPT
jgi:hypothetical protein